MAVLLPNRIDYVAAWYGLTKIGVASALINNHLAGAPLAHCLRVADASHVIVDGETASSGASWRSRSPSGRWVNRKATSAT